MGYRGLRGLATYRGMVLVAAFGGVGAGGNAYAVDEPDPSASLKEIVVVGTTPVPGLRVNADKVPGNVQTLYSSDLTKGSGTPDLLKSMSSQMGSINFNDNSADPFQPDVLYRGFEASPVLGTPQGLAVYENGVRINEAFGDSVNWDLIPDIAINRVDIVSGSPVFGLNALGGAMSVSMKSGFTYQGLDAELSGGSFNQRAGEAEFGFNQGMLGFYAAARIEHQQGWRLFAQDSVKQYYMDLTLHGDGPSIDLSYSRANNRLYGQGAAPVQSLAINPENVFTGPQNNIDNLDFFTLNSAWELTKTFAVQSVAYFRNYRQTLANGDASDYEGCTDTARLCQSDGITPLMDTAGGYTPDLTEGGNILIGQNDYESIHSQTWGGSLQFTNSAKLFEFGNAFAVGATLDVSETKFFSGTEIGVLNSELTVLPSPYFVDTSEGTDWSATPVALNANNKYYGFYATDTVDVTDKLSVTIGGRYNLAKVDLTDLRGTFLNGNNRFAHFDPALGATFKLFPDTTVYAGYSTDNRAPTASEIECSDPLRPCLLPSSLAGDPPNLKQVISKTTEVGIRGRIAMPGVLGALTWNASVYRTNLEDDIYPISTSLSTGFFQNIGSTRRQGIETGMTYRDRAWTVNTQFSYINATFRSPLVLHSPQNPYAGENGNIPVEPGDQLPLIPKVRVKLGADYELIHDWTVGGSVNYTGPSFYRGDESNQNPELPGYTVVSLRTTYRINKQVELFANVQNLTDRRYSTFGLYGDPTRVGAPGVPDVDTNGPGVDNRFQSPAMPRAYFGGVRVTF